ncbi:MAG: isoprenylcysteine carboxylmethyltransferase family protein [Candidatus Koribacter versatilis]|uniref:Isoprenylcysteine carboxylmethyltransferase family protein n=1 Tax=Candidatus Korobacter versatilis TaxID=658062 RepID=A0A932EQ20_9BACT|nr:isoprenylcysteine carboxylmethyltransferase family protein [Candidatus Koribacter versatilis]
MTREQRGAIIVTVAPIVLIGFLINHAMGVTWDLPRALGFAFAIVFLVLLTIARIQLGTNFSVTPQARALVTTGLYSRIRNPVYVFSTPAIAGFLVYLHYFRGALLFLAVIIPIQWLRARAEARVLEAKFGDQYRNYRAKTWF